MIILTTGKNTNETYYNRDIYVSLLHQNATPSKVSFLSYKEGAATRPIGVLTRYLIMLEDFLKEYGLLRPDEKTADVTVGGEAAQEQEKSADELIEELNTTSYDSEVEAMQSIEDMSRQAQTSGWGYPFYKVVFSS